MSRSSRRGVLRGIATLSAAGALPAAAYSSPDADLLIWCARWAEADACFSTVTEPYAHTLDDPPPEVEAAAAAFSHEAHDMLERIQTTPAQTVAGWRAKAKVALRINLDAGDEASEALAWGLLRDLLAGDPYLAAMDRVDAARTALAAQAKISKPGEVVYERLNALARRAETEMARAVAL